MIDYLHEISNTPNDKLLFQWELAFHHQEIRETVTACFGSAEAAIAQTITAGSTMLWQQQPRPWSRTKASTCPSKEWWKVM